MSRTLCPDCGANRGIQTSSTLSYCHSCKKARFNKSLIEIDDIQTISNIELPRDLVFADSKVVPAKIKEWLAQYYITENHIAFNKIMWSNSIQRIVFVYNKARSAWARSTNPRAKNKWLHLGSNKVLYSYKASNCFNKVVIVEDCISCIRVSDYVNCISLGGTNIQHLNKVDLKYIMQGNNLYITWFDGDKAGQKAAEAFRNRYKLYLNIRNIVTTKDPKCHTPSEMQEVLNEFKWNNYKL